MYRGGLDRFKKAQSLEPFSVTFNPAPNTLPPLPEPISAAPAKGSGIEGAGAAGVHVTQVGGGQSAWQPPDWAVEPRPGLYYLEVLKDREVLDKITLDKRRHIFGRQIPTCDFVLDHQSVSRQHAAVVPHKNGSIYVIDLGSVHGTFVANERLTKDNPVELEVGQSLRFAASTRIYVLRKNVAALFTTPLPTDIILPSPPDPADEDAVVSYNTILNRYGISKSDISSSSDKASEGGSSGNTNNYHIEKLKKRKRRLSVAFRDQVGGELVEVVGISDGADVDTEPGPIGVKEGSLVGRYESLVHITVIPKGRELIPSKEVNLPSKGVTDKLREVFNKVKGPPKGGIYDDLYGDSFSAKTGATWACRTDGEKAIEEKHPNSFYGIDISNLMDDNDDLFGD